MEELKLPEHFEEYAEGRKAGFLKMKAAKEDGRPADAGGAGRRRAAFCQSLRHEQRNHSCRRDCSAQKPLSSDQVQLRFCFDRQMPVYILGGPNRR